MRSIIPVQPPTRNTNVKPAAQLSFSQLMAVVIPAPTKKMAEGMNNLKANLIAFFGHEPMLEEITPLRCVRFFSWLSVHKKSSTAITYQKRMTKILRLAYRRGYYPFNIDDFCVRMPSVAPVQENQYLTKEEVQQIAQTPCPHPCCRDAFVFACHTGLKLAEIEALRWERVIKKGKRQYIAMGEDRVNIPLSSKALAIIEQYRAEENNDTVFPLPSRTTVSTDLRTMAKATGIDPKRMTFQVSKYTFKALMTQAGADVFVTSKLCGTNRPFPQGFPVEPNASAYDHAIDLLDKLMGK